MANTGYKSFALLELYYTDDNSYAGTTKANVITDEDYIAPVLDIVTCPPSVRYYNEQISRSATKNNCNNGLIGSTVTLTAYANQFVSNISVAEANTQANTWLDNNAQIHANNVGECIVQVIGPFISTWKTENVSDGSSSANQVKLPLISTGTYDMLVDWGDGTSSQIVSYNLADVTHTYALAGTYTISISGKCLGWYFNGTGDRLKILNISQWGCLEFGQTGYNFYVCSNLTLSNVADPPLLPLSTNLAYIFAFCTSITTIKNLNNWNFQNVNDFNGFFFGATSFNQSITFNIPNVTNLFRMFFNCSSLNSTINITAPNAVTTTNMFTLCTSLNSPVILNITKVTSMDSMFSNCTNFNQPLDTLNVSTVTNFVSMFANCTNFNQPLSNWATTSAQNMSSMFINASAFNQNIGSWNVSNVTNFSQFMYNVKALSSANLDAIYNGWSSRPVKPSVSILFDTKYTSASAAGRALLTGAPNNWQINDNGI